MEVLSSEAAILLSKGVSLCVLKPWVTQPHELLQSSTAFFTAKRSLGNSKCLIILKTLEDAKANTHKTSAFQDQVSGVAGSLGSAGVHKHNLSAHSCVQAF